MCISASVSYSAAAVLVTAGLYAFQHAGCSRSPYKMWALIPVFFGFQQAFEGRVWQALEAGNANAAVLFALGFHFFSHFLWLWWIPLCSYLVEPGNSSMTGKVRKRVFGGCAIFGAFAGALVYSFMLFNYDWMSVAVTEHAIRYSFAVPYRSSIHVPASPALLYGMTILVPLFFSSHRLIIIFGVLVALSMWLASEAYSAAFVSVWCFFAAVLSLYLVYMIRRLVAGSASVSA